MNIVLTTLGSRGDLQPFVALGAGLQAAGFSVKVLTAQADEAFVRSYGLDFFPFSVNIQQLLEGAEIQQMAKSDNPLQFFSSHIKGSSTVQQAMRQTQRELWEGCQGADAIIYHAGMANAFYVAQAMGIPAIMASPFPASATAAFPSFLFYNGPRLGKWYNLLTHRAFEQGFWLMARSAARAFWRERGEPARVLSTPPMRLQVQSGQPILYGFSQHLLPRPADWPDHLHVTGSWMLPTEANWTPPADLQAFLAAGPAPVYIGFGSMKDGTAFGQTAQIVADALVAIRQRGVLALGWNQLPAGIQLPQNIFLLDSVPHSWLFPQVAAVVHHGGAGTTAAGLQAGKPTIIIPHTGDQPAWGRRVSELGVGPRPIARKRLTVNNLMQAIREALEPQVVQRAAVLGAKLRAENGVDQAVAVVVEYLKKGK